MTAFFIPSGHDKYKGRPPTTIYTVLNRDLKRLQKQELRLRSKEDLLFLTSKADDRDMWRELTKEIREAAEASQSDD